MSRVLQLIKVIFLFFILVFQLQISAQIVNVKPSQDLLKDATFNGVEYLGDYFKTNPPQSFDDSVFFNAYNYLNTVVKDVKLLAKINQLKKVIERNWASNEICKLERFYDSILLKKHNYDSIIYHYRERQRLSNIADTADVSSSDSNFMAVLDEISTIDAINYDSIFNAPFPYTDSLLRSIKLAIKSYSDNEIISWIKTIRKDTFNFYLINLDGDSTLIPLYPNNPEIIKYEISDFWGSTIRSVIRNIQSNSIRLLVDDAPELSYETSEKAKRAINSRKKFDIDNYKLEIPFCIPPANTDFWRFYGNSNLDLSQIGMNEYWARGGEPSISLLASVELFLNYKSKLTAFDNLARFRYGVIRQGYYKDKTSVFRSSEDKLEISTKYGYEVRKELYLSIMGDFKSQFAPAYNYNKGIKTELNSKFMSPGYLTLSIGLDYKPNFNTTIFIAPISDKTTFVLDSSIDPARYGVDSTSRSRSEFGLNIKAHHKIKVWGGIEMDNSLELFSNYINNPQNIDIDWELKLILPVNDYIRATIQTSLVYDDDVKIPVYKYDDISGARFKTDLVTKKIQFKEFLTIGFSYKF